MHETMQSVNSQVETAIDAKASYNYIVKVDWKFRTVSQFSSIDLFKVFNFSLATTLLIEVKQLVGPMSSVWAYVCPENKL